jgi:hypothetical protein
MMTPGWSNGIGNGGNPFSTATLTPTPNVRVALPLVAGLGLESLQSQLMVRRLPDGNQAVEFGNQIIGLLDRQDLSALSIASLRRCSTASSTFFGASRSTTLLL